MSRAPARIDLAGGTLDIPPLCFFQRETLTLNLAIDLVAEIRLDPGGSGMIRSKGRDGVPIPELELFARAFAYFDLAPEIDVWMDNSIPRASGLGGSSSILVALVRALAGHVGRDLDARGLLGAVTVLENRLLGKPAGTQDAVAAIYGGLSEIRFETGQPSRRALELPAFLAGPLYLAYSTEEHHSGMNNWSLIQAACEGDTRVQGCFAELSTVAHDMHRTIREQRAADFSAVLEREASLRRLLWPGIETPAMRALADSLPERYTAKVCGAGGGGCMWLFGLDPDPDELASLTRAQGLQLLTVHADRKGSGLS